jgi:hypothetical protein
MTNTIKAENEQEGGRRYITSHHQEHEQENLRIFGPHILSVRLE